MIVVLEDKDHLPNSKRRIINRKDGLQSEEDIKVTVIVNIYTDHDLDHKLQGARLDIKVTVI